MNHVSSGAQKVSAFYQTEFGRLPRVFAAPGRVNLIGEHTDYNEGYVLPAAINASAWLAIGPAEEEMGRWISADFSSSATIDFSNITPHAKTWVNYLLGVVDQFVKMGITVPPFHAVLSSEVPIGAGLSSSAALESAMAVALNTIIGAGLPPMELARIAQRAENQFIGLQCGIMDMFASIHGRKNHVMRIDCRDLSCAYFPLELGDHRIVLMDTGVKHSLASSEYNLRRQQCEDGVAMIAEKHKSVRSLRDVSVTMLEEYKLEMDPLVHKRCAYVVAENDRVLATCTALQSGNLAAVGEYLFASHEGLQHLYEVSCPELDLLVDLVRDDPAVLGSRMMGGGFGGCTISLVHKDAVSRLAATIGPIYHQRTGRKMQLQEVVTGDGAREIHS
jgi:galactokinase